MIPPYFFYCPHPKEIIIPRSEFLKRTQAVMTVCKDKGNRKFFHTAGNCRLCTPIICHVMAYKRIKFRLRFSISDEVLWAFSIDQAIVPSFAVP